MTSGAHTRTGHETTEISCIIHHTSLYYTPDITVSYTIHHCMIHHTSLCHTPDITVSYTTHHCMIHKTSLYHTPDITVSYTMHHRIILQTSLFHTPYITVSYTIHHCIIHHTSLHDTPDITVSYTRHHCIIHIAVGITNKSLCLDAATNSWTRRASSTTCCARLHAALRTHTDREPLGEKGVSSCTPGTGASPPQQDVQPPFRKLPFHALLHTCIPRPKL